VLAFAITEVNSRSEPFYSQSRNPPLLSPSLTVAHFPSLPVPSTTDLSDESAILLPIPTLSHILAQLLPLTRTLPLSLETLNKIPFSPESKDEDLHSGLLQIPHGSVLLVTENGIKEGKLVERGTAGFFHWWS
jgi:hypothetical protein